MRKDLRINDPLTLEELQVKTPSAFTNHPHPRMSSRYVFVPTNQVINDMLSLGWQIGNAFEVNSKKEKGFQKHCVEFFRPDLVIERNGETMYPTIILKNSHNGLSGFEFRAGIYRLVCSNGLVVADQEFGKIFIKHIGYNFGTLAETIFGFITNVEEMSNKINQLMETELTEEQAVEFAHRSAEIRMLKGHSMSLDNVLELLEVRRPSDRGLNLWRVLNRVQENIISGSYITKNEKGHERKARPIKNFELDLEYNQKLWEIASEFVVS